MSLTGPWRTSFFCLLALARLSAPAGARTPVPAYKGAIVVDAATGNVIFADNADVVTPPASMTKLMTFAVMDDMLRAGTVTLQTPIKITAEDARIPPSKVDLRAGEVFPLEELVYAMMIKSANDAAYAIGRSLGGNVASFVGMMNAKARALGMLHTTFRTPNGYPVASHRVRDGDLTTPRDFALLCRYVLQSTDVLKYTRVKERLFGKGIRMPPLAMTNHNHLLGKIIGVDGLKTGYTEGAGFCLAATAARNGRRVIVVMMDSPDTRSRDLGVARLIDLGFRAEPPPPAPVIRLSVP